MNALTNPYPALARADIGAQFEARRKAWVWVAYRGVMIAAGFRQTIPIGSLLGVRAPCIRPAALEAQKAKKSKRRCDTLPVLRPDASGIDVGGQRVVRRRQR